MENIKNVFFIKFTSQNTRQTTPSPCKEGLWARISLDRELAAEKVVAEASRRQAAIRITQDKIRAAQAFVKQRHEVRVDVVKRQLIRQWQANRQLQLLAWWVCQTEVLNKVQGPGVDPSWLTKWMRGPVSVHNFDKNADGFISPHTLQPVGLCTNSQGVYVVNVLETEADVDQSKEDEVHSVVGERTRKGHIQYRIRWKGYDSTADTWEPLESLKCDKLLNDIGRLSLV